MKTRTIVIPDIHGISFMPKRILNKLHYNVENDKVVFLGDYINRGKTNKNTVDYIIDLKNYNKDIITLMGNHDAFLLDFLENTKNLSQKELEAKYINTFYTLNFKQTLQEYYPNVPIFQNLSYIRDRFILDYPEIYNFFKKLDYYHEDENYLYVHAGINPFEQRIENTSKEEFYDISRDRYLNIPHQYSKSIISGHTPAYTAKKIMNISTRENAYAPYASRDKILLDTGAVFGYALYALTIDNLTGDYEFHDIGFSDYISDSEFYFRFQERENIHKCYAKVIDYLNEHYTLSTCVNLLDNYLLKEGNEGHYEFNLKDRIPETYAKYIYTKILKAT